MIGKILRFAFLEKDARKRWEAAAAKKAAARKGAAKQEGAKQGSPKPAPSPRTPSPREAEAPDDAAAIRAAIEAAHAEMVGSSGPGPGPGSGPGRTPTPGRGESASADAADRRQLIRSALTVHKLKQSALDDLDPQQRAQLRLMAEKMLGVDPNRR